MPSELITQLGAFNWTAPTGVTSVTVTARAGSGGSGGRNTTGNGGAGGGGGGAVSVGTITTVPATAYFGSVGLAGTGGSSSNGNGGAGGDSYIIGESDIQILAKGGQGGTGGIAGAGGAGGLASGGLGTTKFNGGTGGAGAVGYSGGGGGGAGNAAPGGNASTTGIAGGSAGNAGGGIGANGRTTNGTGLAGSTPGGGAGGAFRATTGGPFAGSAGQRGEILLEWTSPSPPGPIPNLVATAVSGAINLAWTAATNAVSHLVQRRQHVLDATDYVHGPQTGVTQPAGSITISNALPDSIQTAVTAGAVDDVFWLPAGIYTITGAITPKNGQTFVGEYGAIVDGTGWSSVDVWDGGFRAFNQDINDVTISNLIIRNMPKFGVQNYQGGTGTLGADRWIVEYCEIYNCFTGVNMGDYSVFRNNKVHHCSPTGDSGGGYAAYNSDHVTYEENEFYACGGEQKMVNTTFGTWRNNHVHDCGTNGIWFDFDNTDIVIEGNVVEDCGGSGIFIELSSGATIFNNTVRRNGAHGVYISTSKNCEIYNNLLELNDVADVCGVNYFVNCGLVGSGAVLADLSDNNAHDNTIVSATGLANALLNIGTCTGGQMTPYLDGTKNLVFQGNHYYVSNLAGAYWYWGSAGGAKTFAQWQALGRDTTGTIALGS